MKKTLDHSRKMFRMKHSRKMSIPIYTSISYEIPYLNPWHLLPKLKMLKLSKRGRINVKQWRNRCEHLVPISTRFANHWKGLNSIRLTRKKRENKCGKNWNNRSSPFDSSHIISFWKIIVQVISFSLHFVLETKMIEELRAQRTKC